MADKKDWLERVRAERRDLSTRLAKLEDFLAALKNGGVRIEDQPGQGALLMMQREVMRQYLIILDRRIELGELRASIEHVVSNLAEAPR